MTLKIHQERLDLIKLYCEKGFPNESCGFLLGTSENRVKIVEGLIPAENEFVDEEKYHRFLITPDAHQKAEKTARKRGQDVIGFYHSHPSASAKPSDYDREHAWPWYSYLIVSVYNQKAENAASWVLSDGRERFDQEDMEVLQESLRTKAFTGCYDIA